MSFENNKEIIDLEFIYEINKEINIRAETKSYYALVLLGLLSVPLFTLFVDILKSEKFNFCRNKILFIVSLSFFLVALITLLFSFIPSLAILKRKQKDNSIKKIYEKHEKHHRSYHSYRFWADLKFVNFKEVVEYFNKAETEIIGSKSFLKEIINIAWIAKIKFYTFNISIILQMLLISLMFALTLSLIFS